MPNMIVTVDEEYPVYLVIGGEKCNWNREIEVTEEEEEFITRAFEDYKKAQRILRDKYERATIFETC